MRNAATTALAAMLLIALTGCGADPSTRVQFVAQGCKFDVEDVPAETEWEVVSDLDPPRIDVTFDDGRTAEIAMTDGTTVDNIEENLRVNSVACNDGENEFDDRKAWATWSPDGETFTLETEEYYDPDETEQDIDPAGAAVSEPPAPGVFTGANIVEWVVAHANGHAGDDWDTFDCGPADTPYVDGETTRCTMISDTGALITLHATVSVDENLDLSVAVTYG